MESEYPRFKEKTSDTTMFTDFPVTTKYAEKDSTNMNVLLNIDLNGN